MRCVPFVIIDRLCITILSARTILDTAGRTRIYTPHNISTCPARLLLPHSWYKSCHPTHHSGIGFTTCRARILPGPLPTKRNSSLRLSFFILHSYTPLEAQFQLRHSSLHSVARFPHSNVAEIAPRCIVALTRRP